MYHGVGVAVKDDRRDRDGWPVSGGALMHSEKRRRSVMRGTGRKSGMHPRRREHIGIGSSDDGRRRTTGGQPGNVHARGVRRMIAQDRACDPAISDGSPVPRTWSDRLNQFQHLLEFAPTGCEG